MSKRSISIHEFDPDRIIVEEPCVEVGKVKKVSYTKAKILYSYPCSDCQNPEKECKICGKECMKCSGTGVIGKPNKSNNMNNVCSFCNGKKTLSGDESDTLRVFVEKLKSNRGLTFSNDSRFYGGGSIDVSVDYNQPYHVALFGDSNMSPGVEDGFLKNLWCAIIANVQEYGNEDHFPLGMEPEDILKREKLIKPHMKAPPTDAERAKSARGSTLPKTPTKFFNIRYAPSKPYNTDDDRVISKFDESQKMAYNRVLNQKKNGIATGEIPDHVYTITNIQRFGLKKGVPDFVPSSIKDIHNAPFSFTAYVEYPEITFVSKPSIKEVVSEIGIIEFNERIKSSMLSSNNDIKRLELTADQAIQNEDAYKSFVVKNSYKEEDPDFEVTKEDDTDGADLSNYAGN